jgi:hypothetical protein
MVYPFLLLFALENFVFATWKQVNYIDTVLQCMCPPWSLNGHSHEKSLLGDPKWNFKFGLKHPLITFATPAHTFLVWSSLESWNSLDLIYKHSFQASYSTCGCKVSFRNVLYIIIYIFSSKNDPNILLICEI